MEEKLERKHEVAQTLKAEKERLGADHEAEKTALSAEFQAENEKLSAEFEAEKEKLCDAYDRLRLEKESLRAQIITQEEQHKGVRLTNKVDSDRRFRGGFF